ncbi:hypothetical protein [Nocardia huaxiensis]|uniref:Resolvase/invertase-type recombinase catalytic domain-containing protein n=1 Tax=Nocardia huaxiensis TaxID=2755382 RepID=A0A7D6V9W1_9NOCA|nr:hypothetical protein [Nocardia huaxiensis]QLY29931.1 hypothetical protein H0264_32775 [Nocardia huaxiensis]UFS96483.1 hypothetical protein LPY97_00620 [Nocardia huaxiensis]
MGLLPSAVGFLRSDVSGLRQSQDEMGIRRAAKRTGYELRKTIVFGERTEDRVRRLRVAIDRLGVEAVIVPSAEHFDGGAIPAELLEVAAVITASPEQVWGRTHRSTC